MVNHCCSLEEHPFKLPARRTRVAPVPSLEGGVGLLGSGAAGAAITYLTDAQTAIIQPNQILQVQFSEDWQ
ncbi:hypothetical protein [Coleofasciculus sp. FACHB-1120]|uniref:hypothetical protein n=1 Tax=Coleofasciculus sp. FACHB-1120 TaxID=2692783 RepID=UPI0016876062|nr:hypothetical protein [Coleofasciculus sp. FACHB-1120]MBD2740474.1 hypothetical protein [Coleofasciculus sp. FACHB-1120]